MSTKKEFCELPVENCYDWLKVNCPKGYDQVKNFIEKYGHRGVQEVRLTRINNNFSRYCSI